MAYQLVVFGFVSQTGASGIFTEINPLVVYQSLILDISLEGVVEGGALQSRYASLHQHDSSRGEAHLRARG